MSRHPYALMTSLADVRRERGLTLADVAYRMGRARKSAAHIGRMEAADVDPLLSTVVDYAAAVGMRLAIESVDAGQVGTIPGVPAELVARVEQSWRGIGALAALDTPNDELVARVEQSWRGSVDLPRLPRDELWALIAARHDDIAAAYAELLDALPEQAGLLRCLALDAREHRLREASEARGQLERARPVGDLDTGRAVDR